MNEETSERYQALLDENRRLRERIRCLRASLEYTHDRTQRQEVAMDSMEEQNRKLAISLQGADMKASYVAKQNAELQHTCWEQKVRIQCMRQELTAKEEELCILQIRDERMAWSQNQEYQQKIMDLRTTVQAYQLSMPLLSKRSEELDVVEKKLHSLMRKEVKDLEESLVDPISLSVEDKMFVLPCGHWLSPKSLDALLKQQGRDASHHAVYEGCKRCPEKCPICNRRYRGNDCFCYPLYQYPYIEQAAENIRSAVDELRLRNIPQ